MSCIDISMATIIVHVPLPGKTSTCLRKKAMKLRCASSKTTSTNVKLTSVLCTAHSFIQIPMESRRSGNYKPPSWNFDYIQSLNSKYNGETYLRRVFELKTKVTMMLDGVTERVDQLELIDDMQKLGISYHFEDKIKKKLENIYYDRMYGKNEKTKEMDLYSTALEFKLLRQHGFSVSQEVFECFKSENGGYKAGLSEDTKGLLQLYEASFLLIEGENTLELAREFATKFLQKKLDEGSNSIDDYLALLVGDALDLPFHWRVEMPMARWFIKVYEKRPDMNPVVLELAKLDFNIVQAMHQEELKHVSRWWKQTSLAEKLPFARDRLVECYFWTTGVFSRPQYGYSRIMVTKVNALITIIDDIFDVYGTLEELHLFNNAIQRWDIEAMDQLPYYMKMCYLALNNFIYEMAYDVLKEQGFLIISYLRKPWADLCAAYLQEAKWFSSGYTPKLEEYISNARISISAPVVLCYVFLLVTNPIEKRVMDQRFYEDHTIVRCSSMLLRLANDLGTSSDEMKRGDVPKSLQCYMNETGASREEAREYIKCLIREIWKMMNKERVVDSSFTQDFVRSAVDLGRMAQYMYQHGDGHGIQNAEIKDRISSLLFEPIV